MNLVEVRHSLPLWRNVETCYRQELLRGNHPSLWKRKFIILCCTSTAVSIYFLFSVVVQEDAALKKNVIHIATNNRMYYE